MSSWLRGVSGGPKSTSRTWSQCNQQRMTSTHTRNAMSNKESEISIDSLLSSSPASSSPLETKPPIPSLTDGRAVEEGYMVLRISPNDGDISGALEIKEKYLPHSIPLEFSVSKSPDGSLLLRISAGQERLLAVTWLSRYHRRPEGFLATQLSLSL